MRVLGISAYYHDSAAALIEDGTISGKIAKEVFEAMWTEGKGADEIIDARTPAEFAARLAAYA